MSQSYPKTTMRADIFVMRTEGDQRVSMLDILGVEKDKAEESSACIVGYGNDTLRQFIPSH